MNVFLFRFSRLLSVIIFILLIISNYHYFVIEVAFYDYTAEGVVGIIFINLVTLLIGVIFNWLCFGKLTVWVKKINLEE